MSCQIQVSQQYRCKRIGFCWSFTSRKRDATWILQHRYEIFIIGDLWYVVGRGRGDTEIERKQRRRCFVFIVYSHSSSSSSHFNWFQSSSFDLLTPVSLTLSILSSRKSMFSLEVRWWMLCYICWWVVFTRGSCALRKDFWGGKKVKHAWAWAMLEPCLKLAWAQVILEVSLDSCHAWSELVPSPVHFRSWASPVRSTKPHFYIITWPI